jgi:phage/plasmid-associated DNA primase
VTAVLAPPVTRAPFTVADGGLVKKPFARTDLGNAERFVAQHGTDVRWVPAWSKWLLWDESRWRIDETLDVMRLAHDTVRRMYVEVGELPSLDARKDLTKHAVRSIRSKRSQASRSRRPCSTATRGCWRARTERSTCALASSRRTSATT